MSFLSLRNLQKVYGTFTAVHGLDLDIEKGEFLSLLGPSGCGKTTTLQMIAGFVRPTAGSILLEGRDLGAVEPHSRGLGMVFQSYALFPHMTVAENVAFGLEMRKVPSQERRERVDEALQLVGLAGLSGRYPRQMSGGQQQRVALARAIVIRPHILLLDEPLSNLDAKLREEMQGELRRIQRKLGTTTILVTHDQAEAMALSDRIVVMNAGRIVQVGPPEETYERPSTAFVANFLGRTNTLQGAADGARLRIDQMELAFESAVPGPVEIAVRPEKMRFADAGLSGRVLGRVFQGSHWLCEVETAVGGVLVIHPNTGSRCPAEGEQVHLSWKSSDMLVSSVAGGIE